MKYPIDRKEQIVLGGLAQTIHIWGTNPENPVLLFLHGGPGVPNRHAVAKNHMDLIEDLTIVAWDQRGTGGSYFGCDPKDLTLEQLIQDGQLHQYVWNKLYRRKTIGSISFAKGKTNEDEFWTYQVFGQAKRVVKISDVLYNYYQRPDSIMGAGYNLKRLDALEAKTQRQQYLERCFPELRTDAKISLYFSCVYAGQMALKYIPKQELQTAKERINQYVNLCQLQNDEVSALTGGSKLWYQILRRNFWLGCRLRNLTKRGF